MAITFVAANLSEFNNATSANWTLPTGVASGDVALFWWYTCNNKTITPDAALTARENVTNAGRMWLGYKVLGGGDTAGATTPFTSSSSAGGTTIWGTTVFRGVDTTTVFDVTDPTPLGGSSQTIIDVPDVTTATAGAMVFCLGGRQTTSMSALVNNPTIGGTVGTSDTTNTLKMSALGNGAAAMVAWATVAAAGATTVTSFGITASSNEFNQGITVALLPGAAAAGGSGGGTVGTASDVSLAVATVL